MKSVDEATANMAVETDRGAVDRYRTLRRRAYDYRYEADLPRKVALAAGMAALTGLLAQVRIVLPFTPVPITGQTFAVMVTGVVLGARWGGLSMGIYTGAGVAGMPWFQGWGAGLSHFTGATGGYLIGFVVAAGVIGFAIDRLPATRRLPWLPVLLAFGNFVVIFAFGLPWLAAWMAGVLPRGPGTAVTVHKVLVAGFYPFVAGGVVKVAAATAVARLVLPPADGDEVGAAGAEEL